ncbi:hypothetical protein BACCAC_00241 [Bacteroides caccae ATCC 43185]|nr:hypothetical protein BACCAC_00241 [Bacteroides caccae ATCC 43185]
MALPDAERGSSAPEHKLNGALTFSGCKDREKQEKRRENLHYL